MQVNIPYMEHMGCFQVFLLGKKAAWDMCVCGPVVAQQSVCVAVWVFFIGMTGMSVRINCAYTTEFLLFNPFKKYLGKNSHVSRRRGIHFLNHHLG